MDTPQLSESQLVCMQACLHFMLRVIELWSFFIEGMCLYAFVNVYILVLSHFSKILYIYIYIVFCLSFWYESEFFDWHSLQSVHVHALVSGGHSKCSNTVAHACSFDFFWRIYVYILTTCYQLRRHNSNALMRLVMLATAVAAPAGMV